jgi:hypothetical protein
LRARHAHGRELEIHRIAPEIRLRQTRQPRRMVHEHTLLQPRYHDGGVERHAARVVGKIPILEAWSVRNGKAAGPRDGWVA